MDYVFSLFTYYFIMKRLGKMKVSDKFYKEVIEETKEILKDFNCDMLVNWENNTLIIKK